MIKSIENIEPIELVAACLGCEENQIIINDDGAIFLVECGEACDVTADVKTAFMKTFSGVYPWPEEFADGDIKSMQPIADAMLSEMADMLAPLSIDEWLSTLREELLGLKVKAAMKYLDSIQDQRTLFDFAIQKAKELDPVFSENETFSQAASRAEDSKNFYIAGFYRAIDGLWWHFEMPHRYDRKGKRI